MRTPFSLASRSATLLACATLAGASIRCSNNYYYGNSNESPDAGADGSSGVFPVPQGCDPQADPKDAPNCAVSEYAIFVDSNRGSDDAAGSKTAPFKTIGTALSKLQGKPRIYVCDGTYEEAVEVKVPVLLIGGFKCGSWAASTAKPILKPKDATVPLRISNVSDAVSVFDFDIQAADAVAPGDSSIAVFVANSANVTFQRAAITAGAGKDGIDGGIAPSNLFSEKTSDLNGSNASDTMGGAAKTCACKLYGSSTGGKGGDASMPGGDGSAVPMPSPTAGRTGTGGSTVCTSGADGADGAPRKPGSKPTTYGNLSATEWLAATSTDGDTGNPGGGGGGGGGKDTGGGGGGCGGCGGTGGLAGKPGGSSIAIASFTSALTLKTCIIHASKAANGGGGGGGGGGGTMGSCGGGKGGAGAGGSGGAGGNGGLSVAVLRSKGSASLDETTQAQSKLGTPGLGGKGGTGGAGGPLPPAVSRAPKGLDAPAGSDGLAQLILELP